MISDWKHIEKSNLTIFMLDKLFVSSKFYRTVIDNKFINIKYNYEFPEVITNYYKNLEKVGINLLFSYWDKYLEIDWRDNKKLNLLYKILFENNLWSDIYEIVIKLNQKYTRVESFEKDININNNDLFFNDIEIYIHALIMDDANIKDKLEELAYSEKKVISYEEFKTKEWDIITYNIKEKIIKVNNKLVQQTGQVWFFLALLSKKWNKASYQEIENFFNDNWYELSKKSIISDVIYSYYSNIKQKTSSLNPAFENITIHKWEWYSISII